VAHATCGAAFPGAHLCHTSEFIVSAGATAITIPAGGAWLDPSTPLGGGSSYNEGSPTYGRYTGADGCTNWTSALSTALGTLLTSDGGMTSGSPCNVKRALACCGTVPKVQFVGYTTANATFSPAGRPAMHGACAAEFASSHMCHVAEYLNASPSGAIPASGAWMDPSVDLNGGSIFTGGAPGMGRYLGGNACTNWTSTAGTNGALVQSDGGTNVGACNVARRIACCQ
jgi:hypothetical protein